MVGEERGGGRGRNRDRERRKSMHRSSEGKKERGKLDVLIIQYC